MFAARCRRGAGDSNAVWLRSAVLLDMPVYNFGLGGERDAAGPLAKVSVDMTGRGDLRQLSADWTTLGAEDPLWAVYVAPGTRGGRWDLDAFFALGREEVDRVLAELDGLGLRPGRRLAVDFGCGVGRLSAALARHVDEVVGVDVAPSMLAEGRRLDRTGRRVRFVLNAEPDLRFLADGSVDLMYSSLVLQHLDRDLAVRYLREFARVLTPGGAAVFQVADRPRRSLKGLVNRLLPWPVLRWVQRRLLGYPAPMRMTALRRRDIEGALAGTGARIVAAVPDESYGGHWIAVRYYVTRHPSRDAPFPAGGHMHS